MVFASVREFRSKGTKSLNGHEEVVITKYGKPIAVLSPVGDRSAGMGFLSIVSPGELLERMGG